MTTKYAASFLENKVLTTSGVNNSNTGYTVTLGSSGSTFLTLDGRHIIGSTSPGDYTAAGQLVSKAYVDYVGITGNVIKETLLSQIQLASNAQGVRPAFGLYFSALPDALTEVSLQSDTHAVETFVEGTDWNRGATAITAMTALAAAITAGTNFDAKYCPELDQFNSPNGIIVVVTKTTPSANDDFRAWSDDVVNTSIVSFNATSATATGTSPTTNYTFENKAGVFVANATDPGVNVDYSGKLYLASALVEPQTHWVLQENAWYTWDTDANQWNLSSANSMTDATSNAGGTGTKGKLTVDEDYALYLTSGVLRLQLETSNPTLEFKAGTPKQLSVKYGTSAGLTQGASGLSLLLASSSGLLLNTSGLQIQLDATTSTSSGLRKDATNGLSAKLEAAGTGTGGLGYAAADAGLNVIAGDGLKLTANGVSADLHTTSGLELSAVDGSGQLRTKLEGTTPTLQINGSNELGVKTSTTANSLEATVTGLSVKVDGTSVKRVTASGAVQVGVTVEKLQEDRLTLAGGDITAGYIALTQDPVTIDATLMRGKTSAGFEIPLQEYGVDFTVMNSGGVYYLVWKTSGTGLTGTHPTTGMVGDLATGDKLFSTYTYATHTPAA